MTGLNEERFDAHTYFGFPAWVRLAGDRSVGASSGELQDMRRSAEGLHEELCRPGVRDRIQDVHEGLQKVAEWPPG
jgi:hypothetical protein